MISRIHASSLAALVLSLALGCSETKPTAPSASLGGNSSSTVTGDQNTNAAATGAAANTVGGTSHARESTGTGGSGGVERAPATGSVVSGGTTARDAETGGNNPATGGTDAGGTKSAGTPTGGSPTTRGSTLLTGGRSPSGGMRNIGGNEAGGSTAGGASVGGTALGGESSTGGSGQPTNSGGSASNGGRSSGGYTGTSGAAAGGDSSFVLAWEDNFDTFDSTKWQLMTHSWDGNLAQFSTSNVSTASGVLSVHLTAAANDTAKPYRGVEMRSIKTLKYGRVSARIRFAKGSGVISALVTIYTPWPADNWNEIDIEHLGKSPNSSQLNCMVYTGPPVTPPVTQSVTPTQDPLIVSPGFDAEAAFHEYDIEWTDTAVRFFMDGTLLRTWTKDIARMTLPQNILFTIWASSSADWAGALTPSSVPATADIDWIRVYDWKR